jgi:hypothetical protein
VESRNPKSEARNPKEDRNPNSEPTAKTGFTGLFRNLAFWLLGFGFSALSGYTYSCALPTSTKVVSW